LLVALLGSLSWIAPAWAQTHDLEEPPKLSTYWEFGGNGIFTGNLDARITDTVSLRVGGMLIPITDDVVPWSGVVMVNKLIGQDGHYLEIGGGITALGEKGSANPAESRLWIGPTAAIGYRREVRHTILRATFAPVFVPVSGRRWLPMLGLSVGRTFP
jgi:hypothetical protein